MQGIEEAALEIIGLLESRDVPYALMGGFAVRIYAIPRPTYDVDFNVALPRERLPELYDAAEELGYTIPPPQRTGWIEEVSGLPIVKLQWFGQGRPIDIDIFLAESSFQREALHRRQRHGVGDWQAWFISPEDLLLFKLLADRPKDRIDIADVLFVYPQVDRPYLQTWATKLGIADRLERALAETE